MARVLVVDDTRDIRTFIAFFLGKEGYEVMTCGNPLEVLSLLEYYKFDLILLDIEMPHLNGIQLARKIKKTGKFSNTPIVFLTAENSPDLVSQALLCSPQGYLIKPVKKKKLLEEVNRVAKKNSSHREKELFFRKDGRRGLSKLKVAEPTRIHKITEVNLQILSSRDFEIDQVVELENAIFEGLELSHREFSVISQWKQGDQWLVTLQYYKWQLLERKRLTEWLEINYANSKKIS